jgi:hypothetical protein
MNMGCGLCSVQRADLHCPQAIRHCKGKFMRTLTSYCRRYCFVVIFVTVVHALCTTSALAQTLTPGSPLAEADIALEVRELFAMAEMIYPMVFADSGGWYSYSGYAYQYFAGTKLYVGVKDGVVYALGGAYGDRIIPLGTVSLLTTLL